MSIPQSQRAYNGISKTWWPGLLMLIAALPAEAGIGSVSPSPPSKNIATGQPAAISLIWNVTRDNANCGPTVSSSAGFVRGTNGNGPILLTLLTNLSQTQACPIAPSTQFVFTESIVIPADVIQRAQRLGHSNLVYVRTFDDTIGSSIGQVNMPITGSAAAGFSVTRLALSFDNGHAVRILQPKSSLQAVAEITFNGVGVIQGVWEVANPATTAGEPIYTPISQARQYVGGGEPVNIRSPNLPSDRHGLYLLRFRVTQPELAFDTPIIRYFVAEESTGAGAVAAPMSLSTPHHLALLAADTQFAWQSITDARAYQLEIYAIGRDVALALPDIGQTQNAPSAADISKALQSAPVTGMLVPGNQTRTNVSAAARLRLQPGHAYLWRVLAIGKDGTVIGQSPMRELRMP